jgi:glycosyltransferase involved in cell wall biosynthesis
MTGEEVRETPKVDAKADTLPMVSVLLIAPSLDILGGQAVQAAHLMKILPDVPGQKITFFAISPPPPKPFRWILKIPFLRTVVASLIYNGKLVRAARRADVFHIFTAGLTSYALWTIPALLWGKLYGKKLIVHYHDGQAEKHINTWRVALPTLKMADRVVAPSGFLVDVFAKYGIKAQTIFNILAVEDFVYRKRRKLRPIFMTNRGLEPLYNVECILRAFQIVQAKYPDASLTIANDGFHRAVLERLAQDLAVKNTTFVGSLPHSQMPALYDAADVYLTTPNIDNLPGSILECFASGLPVVATKAGGIPYIAQDRYSALLVDLDDHAGVAARCVELLENDDLVEELTANGLTETKRYGWQTIRDQWSALYREVAGK